MAGLSVPPSILRSEMKHGTVNGYNYHKCRCELCSAAKVAANRASNMKNPGRQQQNAKKHYEDNRGTYLERARHQRIHKKADLRTYSSNRRARVMEAFVERVDHTVLFERDNYTCQQCGIICDKDSVWPADNFPSLDHIIPLSKGGEHSYKNTQCLCLGCNLTKGAKLERPANVQHLLP